MSRQTDGFSPCWTGLMHLTLLSPAINSSTGSRRKKRREKEEEEEEEKPVR